MINPYNNTANKMVGKVRNINDYVTKNVKDAEVRETILEIIEFSKYVAFNEGRKQGKFEVSEALKTLINVENPNFTDFTEE